jgi:hypothetical protein
MTQSVQAICPGCKTSVRVAAQWLHLPLRCKRCQTIFHAQLPAQPAPPLLRPAVGPPAPAGTFVSHQQTRTPPYELLCAVAALMAITIAYVVLTLLGVANQSSSLLGYGLGTVGFLLMLSTETLYSLRKRVPGFTLGRTSHWLRVHIFTGIVGPYLVLLHSAGRFHGLAGALTLVTLIMVASGFVGRYIYTAVPRTLDGVELAVRDLGERIAGADRQLQTLGVQLLDKEALALATEVPQNGWLLVLGRKWLWWRQQRRLRRAMRTLDAGGRTQAAQLQQLLAERNRLQMQINSLAVTRRLLALWHVIHVPLGVVLFTLAFIHIGAALYFATFLK